MTDFSEKYFFATVRKGSSMNPEGQTPTQPGIPDVKSPSLQIPNFVQQCT